VCVISHNHYDHLDLNSVVALATAHPDLIWVVPLGMKQWMAEINVTNVVEMDWSEKIVIEDVSGKKRPPLAVQCESTTQTFQSI
jgi:L-ascorbate metabolism protein UlaG (beta-lactamase superfamily)